MTTTTETDKKDEGSSLGEPNPVYAHLIAAMDRHGFSYTPKVDVAKSHIVQGKNPANGIHFEQRVAGTPTECAAWAMGRGLVGKDFKILSDIYAI